MTNPWIYLSLSYGGSLVLIGFFLRSTLQKRAKLDQFLAVLNLKTGSRHEK